MNIINWLADNYIEVFGTFTGIIYVFLEIRQNLWLWPVGIVTSAVYIWVFLTGKLYADMSLQVYYLVISILGWYWWVKGSGLRAQGAGQELVEGRSGEREETIQNSPLEEPATPERGGQGDVINGSKHELLVSNIKFKTGLILTVVFFILFLSMWFILDHLTDSPIPGGDAFITSLSIIATWMLARKLYEHWYLWIIVNAVAVVIFLTRGLYPTVFLYTVYCIMSFVGLYEWRKTIRE